MHVAIASHHPTFPYENNIEVLRIIKLQLNLLTTTKDIKENTK